MDQDPLGYCTVSIAEDDMFRWTCRMIGPEDTPYAGGIFHLKIEFPSQYPFKPPTITFVTKVYHPSVELETGKICANLLSDGWGPTLNIRHCLAVIYGMLQSPESDHAVEESVAKMLRDKPKEFEKQAKKYTKEYAK
jgi:ubiquitin-conjugating enzyme E2 D